MPLTILPGIIQLARSPFSLTCIAPRIDRLILPPRIIANESCEPKIDEPAIVVLDRSRDDLARVGRGSTCALTSSPDHCATFHAEDDGYWDDVWYWTTATEECLDGRCSGAPPAYADTAYTNHFPGRHIAVGTYQGFAGTPTVLTYTIANTGSADLTLSGFVTGSPVGCSVSVTTAPAGTVAASRWMASCGMRSNGSSMRNRSWASRHTTRTSRSTWPWALRAKPLAPAEVESPYIIRVAIALLDEGHLAGALAYARRARFIAQQRGHEGFAECLARPRDLIARDAGATHADHVQAGDRVAQDRRDLGQHVGVGVRDAGREPQVLDERLRAIGFAQNSPVWKQWSIETCRDAADAMALAGVSVEAIKYFGGKLPLLGVCLGHQALGAAREAHQQVVRRTVGVHAHRGFGQRVSTQRIARRRIPRIEPSFIIRPRLRNLLTQLRPRLRHQGQYRQGGEVPEEP